MEELGNIDLEDKTITCSGEDIQKLSTPAGCTLNLVQDKVYKIDEESFSGDDEVFDDDDDDDDLNTKKSRIHKEERLRRECISLALNAHQDPVSPDFNSRLKELLGDQTNNVGYNHLSCGSKSDVATTIMKRYTRLTDFEGLLKNSENAFEEISPGRVYKRRLVSGVGPTVVDDSLVMYNCAFWTENSSEPYDSSWLRGSTMSTDLSKDSILPGVHELLLTTKVNEICEALIKPEAAFGVLGVMPRIPPNATIFCLLQVIKVITNDKIARLSCSPHGNEEDRLTFEDFLKLADEARTRGNYYFTNGQHRVALQRYKSGIRILDALTYKNETEENRANVLLVKLYNNSAKAANCLGDPRLALAACKQATQINDMEPKTFWLKMSAWKKKGHPDRALGICRRALQLFPDPKIQRSFQREASDLKRKIQEGAVELDNLHRMMGKAIIA